MAYQRTNWVNGAVPYIDAAHLNNIEQGIEDVERQVSNVNVDFEVDAGETENTAFRLTFSNNGQETEIPIWGQGSFIENATSEHNGWMSSTHYSILNSLEYDNLMETVHVTFGGDTYAMPILLSNDTINKYVLPSDTAFVQYDPDSESTQYFETINGDSFEVVIVGPSTGEIDGSLLPIDTSLSSSSDNYHVPSSKCVYDMIGDIETLLEAL